jgi:(2Fe-2S) ferredoxin
MSRDKKPEYILYVCCGSKCKKRGGKHLYKQLKKSAKEKSLRRTIQVIKTGCTDRCKMGPIVAVMPENEWHFHVQEEGAIALFKEIAGRVDSRQ